MNDRQLEAILIRAIRLAIQDGARHIGGAAGAAFSETEPKVYIEKAIREIINEIT